MDRVKRIWYLSPMRTAKAQGSLRIRAVSPEPSLLAHTSSESRGTSRQKARSLAPLNGWACAVKLCHDGMLEDTNSLDGAHIYVCLFDIRKTAVCFRYLSSLQSHWWGFISRNYLVWPISFLMNVFTALKGTYFFIFICETWLILKQLWLHILSLNIDSSV